MDQRPLAPFRPRRLGSRGRGAACERRIAVDSHRCCAHILGTIMRENVLKSLASRATTDPEFLSEAGNDLGRSSSRAIASPTRSTPDRPATSAADRRDERRSSPYASAWP